MCWDVYEPYAGGVDNQTQKGLQTKYLKKIVDMITGQEDDEGKDSMRGNGMSITATDGRIKIDMWSAGAETLVAGAAVAASAMTLF